MKLKVKDGQLTYGSAYKLFVVSWICGVGTFFMGFFLLATVIMFLVGSGYVNGEEVTKRGDLLTSIMPVFVVVPLITVIHAFMFGGLLLFGVWIFRRRGTITVEGYDAPQVF